MGSGGTVFGGGWGGKRRIAGWEAGSGVGRGNWGSRWGLREELTGEGGFGDGSWAASAATGIGAKPQGKR